jgi:hypothetical protein
MARSLLPVGILSLLFAMLPLPSRAARLDLILPTANHALLDGADSAFYQRTISGREEPWRGGTYGFVRNPRGTTEGTVYTRYHGGIDIRPLYRDARGEPLDSILAVADGRVVHVSTQAGASNYGRYIVIEHLWDGSPYYTLYAHLSEAWVTPGQMVRQGEPIARMGHTGDGINRARAHLHFEVNLLLNEHFDSWFHTAYRGDSNHHGIFNGLNLVGVDPARLYRELARDPNLTMRKFLDAEELFFEVRLPIADRIDMLDRYPWLLAAPPSPADSSWRIAFTRDGLPLRVTSSPDPVPAPSVSTFCATRVPLRILTKSLIAGSSEKCALSGAGARYISLMTATADTADTGTTAITQGEGEGEEE